MALSERQKILFKDIEKYTKLWLEKYKEYHNALNEIPMKESEKLREEWSKYNEIIEIAYEELRMIERLKTGR